MQRIKAIAAGLGGLLMAGATLMTPVLAEKTIGQAFPNMNPENTIVVVGQNAAVADVVGAIAVAAELGQHGATAVSAGTSTESVSNGVSLDDPTDRIYMGSGLNSVKDTLTSKDLPNLLEPGTLQDDDGTTYDYKQYIEMGSNAIAFNQWESDEDPQIAVQMSTSDTSPLYTLRVDFSKTVDFTKEISTEKVVAGNVLHLFGSDFTIGSETDDTKLVLYKSSQDITLNKDDKKTVTVGDSQYDIRVIGFDSTKDEVILNVNGVTDSVKDGNSKKIGGLEIYAKTVTSWDNGNQGLAILQVGSEKVTLEDGQPVMIGDDEDEVDGTKVYFNGGGGDLSSVSSIEIKVYAPDNDNDYLAVGKTFKDPFVGTFELKFDSVVPDLKDSSRDKIEIKNSGDNKGYVSFKDISGESRTLYWVYDGKGTGGSNEPMLRGSGSDEKIYVVEGQTVKEDEITILAPGKERYSHLVKVSDIRTGATKGYVQFEDMVSGEKYKTKEGKFNAVNDHLDLIVDGKTYTVTAEHVDANGNVDQISVTYDDNKVAVFPTMEINNGEYLAITALQSSLTVIPTNATLILPTGELDVSTLTTTGAHTNVPVGQLSYDITLDSNYKVTDISIHGVTMPAVVLVEEEDEDNKKNAIVVAENGDGDYVSFNAPAFKSTSWQADTSDSDITAYLDYYGTYAEFDGSDNDHDIVTLWYPDNQMYARLALGPDPQFGVSTTAANINFKSVSPSMAKMDSEVSSTDKASKNLILVGGPAINSLVAELADEGKTVTLDQWRSDYVNKAIVQVVEDAFASGEVALVVAGYEAQDTQNAVAKLISGAVKDKSAVVLSGDTVSDLNLEQSSQEEEQSSEETNSTATNEE